MGRREKLKGSGGQLVVRSLLEQGVDHVFCVPGESHLAVLDALYDARERIKLVVCRHESGASNIARKFRRRSSASSPKSRKTSSSVTMNSIFLPLA